MLNIDLYNTTTLSSPLYYYLCAFSLVFCSSIKSAQIIGHLWLPDSMEAPVPASALIHSATLVSAGVYLLLRFEPLLTLLNLHTIVLVLGSITAAYGGVVASAQTDVKKLLAYSTISHCGFLYVCVGFQNYMLVVVYLFLHGLFKASTFFCVGSFIRVAGSQDTRQMGVLGRYIPVDTILLIICAGNLAGLPFTLGYLYKHMFMLHLVMSNTLPIVVGFCFIGMLSSLVYVFRLVYYAAFDVNKGTHNTPEKKLNNSLTVVTDWSESTYIQSTAVFFLLASSIYFYIFFINILNFNSVVCYSNIQYLYSDFELFEVYQWWYSFYLNFFFVLYVLTISVLIVLECRRTYSFHYKLTFCIYLLVFTFFLVIFLS